MANQIKIERHLSSDPGFFENILPIINKFEKEFFDGAAAPDMDDTVWFLIRSRGVIAYAGMKLVFDETEYQNSETSNIDNRGFFCRAATKEKYRGAGLQKLLIQARLDYLAGLEGDWSAVSYTMPHNYRSSNALISKGFKTYWPCFPEDIADEDVIYWEKPLYEQSR